MQLLSLRSSGRTWRQVADLLAVGRSAAIERARRLGLPPGIRIAAVTKPAPLRLDRPALPSGHPVSWGTITRGTPLDGAPYPYPVFT